MLLSAVFFQSYHDGQLSLLRSTSRLGVLSEHSVLSSVTENQWQGENNLYENMYFLLKSKLTSPLLLSIHLKVRLSIRLTTSQGAKYLKIRLAQFSCQKRFDFVS